MGSEQQGFKSFFAEHFSAKLMGAVVVMDNSVYAGAD